VRRVGWVAVVLAVATLVVLVIVGFVAGADKNSQINSLRHQGVPVSFTISGCLGQLGGSGSNAAGYSCRGWYRLHGQRFDEPIPGDALYVPGTVLPSVAVPGDPALVTTTATLRAEQVSWRVFILPAVLLALLLAGLGLLLVWNGRRSPRSPP